MSANLVTEEISNFLGRKEAEVICIRGKWGVGKTYAWTSHLESAHKKQAIALKRYSYVSLFGVNSLEELKFSIFENVITLSEGLRKADINSLDSFISSLVPWRKLTRILQNIPVVQNFAGADITTLISFMTIHDQIICIDDLERRGQKLDINDVLGMISYLREQRNCKIVLILNDEQLETESKLTFEKHLEKVIDISLTYEPTSVESVKIAISDSNEFSRHISERCIALNITNIRVLRRITHFGDAIMPLLFNYEKEVKMAALSSLVLFSWSRDQPDEAPPLEFLRSKTIDRYTFSKKEERQPKEIAWNTLLTSYGYSWTDDFDLALIKGVCDGYFDRELIQTAAQSANKRMLAAKADGSFESAWSLYHNSFDANQDAVLDGIFASFMKNAEYVSPTNLNGTISLFKDLGRLNQVSEMISHYISVYRDSRGFFDLAKNPFGEHIDVPEVRAAFAAQAARAVEKPDFSTVLLSIDRGWTDDQIQLLSTSPVEAYRNAFKTHSGKELHLMLSNTFQFDRIGGATEQMRKICDLGRSALKLIGEESPVNARRVKQYGVEISAKSFLGSSG